MVEKLLLLILLLHLFCCTDQNNAAREVPNLNTAQKAAIEERLMQELSPENTRAGKQRNDLINYAIDQVWDVQADSAGYFYQILAPGSGETIMEGDLVNLHYRGSFLNGTVFDDSRSRNKPLQFYVGQMIPGWNLALQKMKPGGAMRLLLPSALAYGPEGLLRAPADSLVGAHQVLIFEIDNLQVEERALEREW